MVGMFKELDLVDAIVIISSSLITMRMDAAKTGMSSDVSEAANSYCQMRISDPVSFEIKGRKIDSFIRQHFEQISCTQQLKTMILSSSSNKFTTVICQRSI